MFDACYNTRKPRPAHYRKKKKKKTKHLQVRISGSDTSCLLKTTRYTRSIEDTLYTVVTENISGTRLSVELFGLLLVVLLI